MAVSFSTPSAAAASTDTLDSVTTRGSTTTNSIQVGGVNVAGNYALPTADGTNGQFLQTDGSGSVSFASVSVTGGLTYKGSYNAATSTPSLVTALKGDFYIISVAGSLAGVNLAVGDHIVFNQNAANPVTSAMFDVIDNSEADTLDSVTTRGSTTANSVQVGGLNVAGNYNLPAVDGSNGQAITTNGSGTLSFSTVLTDVVQDPSPQLGAPLDVNGQAITSASNGDITLNPDGTGEIQLGADLIPDADATHTIGSESERFISAYTDLNGAIRFKAKNDSGGVINKGQVVYIKGISGTVPTVGLARANSAATMPAFGLALASANDQAEMQIITFGNLTDVNTTTYSLSLNDTVFVSAATAGALTNSAPAGEANLIQNIGRVIRADASAGIIKVGGAGRSNATPNLDDGKIFKGNASNQAESVALSSVALSSLNDDLSYLEPANNLSDVSSASAARTNLGLGTAATQDIGTTANDVVQLDGSARLPAVDGSQLTNLPAAAGSLLASNNLSDVANISTSRANLGLGNAGLYNVGTAASNVVQLDGSARLPAVDGSQLTNLPAAAGALLSANNLSDVANISTSRANLGLGNAGLYNVGTAASNVVQLDGSARLPAVDGSQLTNLPAPVESDTLDSVTTRGSSTTNSVSTGHHTPSSAGSYDLGSTVAEWRNLYLADNSKIVMGLDQDVELIHDPDDGLILDLGVADESNDPQLQLRSQTTGAFGPRMTFRTDSASPAAGDRVGTFLFQGEDSGSGAQDYAEIRGLIQDPTAANEVGKLSLLAWPSSANARGLHVQGIPSVTSGAKVNIDHDGNTYGLHLNNVLVEATAAELSLLDGGSTVGSSITIADTDGFIVNNGGVTKLIPALDLKTYAGGGGGGGSRTSPTSITTTTTLSAPAASTLEEIYYIDSGSAVTVTLVAASTVDGFKYNLKRLGAGAVTIALNGSDVIDHSGQTSFSLANQYDSITLVSDGTNNRWLII